MGLKDMDIEFVLRRLADRKIDEAVCAGKFDNLAGAGKPLELEPMPAEENSRLRWWALRILRQNDFTPDEVRWRKQIDGLQDDLAAAQTELRITGVVKALNALVRRINTLGTNALSSPMVPVDLETELAKFRKRQAGS